ncbi:MAG: AsmA family protein [Rhodospirillaceae bacterium]
MRKIISAVVIVVILVVGAVVMLPSFIDWNQYKGMATEKVRELTGRDLSIAGAVRIAVWPAPALVAEDITFSNAPGAKAPTMASLKVVEVRIALAPLFAGRVKVETVKLVEPLIELERLPDGRGNWEFTPAAKKPTAAASSDAQKPAGGGSAAAPDITLDNFTIEKGTVIYRDAKAGVLEAVEGINATIAAASLQGPMESNGSLVVHAIPVNYSVSVGQLIQGRTVPLNARVSLDAGALAVQVSGSVVSLLENPQFKGTLKLAGQDLRAAIAAVGGSSPAGGAALPVDLGAQLAASAKAVEFKELALSLAGIQAKGDLQVDLGAKPRFDSRLAINRIDADKLIAGLNAPAPAAPAGKSEKQPAKPSAAAGASKPAPANPKPVAAGPVRFKLPTDVAGALILTVDAIGYGTGVIRDVALNVDLSGGVLKLSQLSAQFPGASDLTVQGQFATLNSVPTFIGDVDANINDLRGVMAWLKLAPPPVPADRLRKIALKTQITATPEQLQVAGLNARFDNSKLEGGVTVALRKRLGLGAALVLDRINVDAYLPAKAAGAAPAKTPAPAQAQAPASGQSAPKSDAGTAAAAANPLAGLAALNTFDANFNLHVKSAVYGGTPLQDVVAEGTLYNGALELKRLSVGKLAGASARISGLLEGLSAVPSAKALRIDASVPDLGALARVAGTKLPLDTAKLGALSLKGRLDGSLLAPSTDMLAGIAGGTVGYKGRLSAMSMKDLLSGQLNVKHADLPTMLRRLGVDYQPAGKLGGIELQADVKGGTDKLDLANIKGAIGKTGIGGAVSAVLSGAKPAVTANLQTGALNIEYFLPAEKRAGLDGPARVQPAALRGPAADAGSPYLQRAARGRWPTTPLDLGALNALDADVTLKAPIIIYGRYLAEKADIAARLKGGVLDVEKLTANLFGGALNGRLKAAAKGNQIGASATVKGLTVEQALVAVTGEPAANGNMDVGLNVAGAGASVATIVGSLGGDANFQLSGMDVRKAAAGSLMSGLLGLFTSLNQLGGKSGNDAAAVGASFAIQRGIATTNDLKLVSSIGNGGAAGSINLPAWTIDLKGKIALAESALMRILKAKVRESHNAVPFSITGSIENPTVKVDTGAVLGAGVPIPGADALLNKAPKGVGNILKGILGGGGGSQPQQQAPAPTQQTPPPATNQQQQPRQQQQQMTPDQIIKKLFKF